MKDDPSKIPIVRSADNRGDREPLAPTGRCRGGSDAGGGALFRRGTSASMRDHPQPLGVALGAGAASLSVGGRPGIVPAAGRPVRQKRFDLLIGAFSRLSEGFAQWGVVIAGDDPSARLSRPDCRSPLAVRAVRRGWWTVASAAFS